MSITMEEDRFRDKIIGQKKWNFPFDNWRNGRISSSL